MAVLEVIVGDSVSMAARRWAPVPTPASSVQVLGGSGHQAARRWAAPAASAQVLGGSVHQGAGAGRHRPLATALRFHLGVSRGDVAFVLAPPSLHVPANPALPC
jgi:hypothetical protein